MDSGLFQWFLCGCYLVGGISIGYWFNEWRQRRRIVRLELVDGITRVIDLTQMMEVILNNAYFR